MADDDAASLHELRRGYHDRIALLRDKTVSMVGDAATATEGATKALLDGDVQAGTDLALRLSGMGESVAAIDSEVLALLALQAPVARDLRVILASRDIGQIAALCLGLCHALAGRVGSVAGVVAAGEMQLQVERTGSATAHLLSQARGAWAVLDEDQARAVVEEFERRRTLQRDFVAALVRMREVPVEAAVDMGTVSRAYERLTDHALEIADRVLFAVTGQPVDVSRIGR